MIRIICLCAALACCFVFGECSLVRAQAGELVLAENGVSDYRIVTAPDPSHSTRHGAQELQMFLEQITGVKLPIVSDGQPQTPKEIIVGDNAHLRKLGVPIDFAALGKEGYVIRTVGDSLIIAGGALRGNMYGVYGFLEDHLGCRWFAPGVSRIPKSARLAIGPIDDCQIPALEYREPYVFGCFGADWCARNRMNSNNSRLGAKHGGKVKFGEGFFVHTFARLVPPDKYFREHPEYFSMVKGQRVNGDGIAQNSQLCCTNTDVIRICTEGIREAMRQEPNATVFSVSQNDCDQYCECPTCQALAKQEDSQMAPVLQLVNHVAEAVEKEFPDKIVETLAYEWTCRPPKTLRPRPNVVIRLCSVRVCSFHPIDKCDYMMSRPFSTDLKDWAKIAPRLWIWEYLIDFHHLLLPFPNLRVNGPNIRFFIANNVKGIFEQGAGSTVVDGEFSALRGYVLAKLLWNSNYDANVAINEFLEAYYGKAATPIRAYIDLLHDYVEQKNIHGNEYMAPVDTLHLTDKLLTQANKLWQRAERLVATEPELLERVKLSRMSVDYGILERARLQAQQMLPVNNRFLSMAATRFKPFCKVLQRSDHHIRLDKKAYPRNLARDLQMKME